MLLVSFFLFPFFFVFVVVLKVVFIAACQMGSLLSHLSVSVPLHNTDGQYKKREENRTGFIHIDGTSYFLSPQPLLKFAPPPKTKKINMEKEKETHKTGILWMQSNCTVLGQVQPANRVTANIHPSWNSAPEPASSMPPVPLPLRASYLRSPVAAGSEQTGCVTTPAEKRRCIREVCASSHRFLPALHQIIWPSQEWLSTWALRHSWGKCSRPSQALFLISGHTSGPASSAPGLLNWDLNFTAFFSCEFQ